MKFTMKLRVACFTYIDYSNIEPISTVKLLQCIEPFAWVRLRVVNLVLLTRIG